MRKVYLDHIRWATVLLVLVYHVFYLFNGVGILGGIPGAENIPALDTVSCVIYPWFMVLLFVIAGISARYALRKRTGRQFIRERAVKLLVPSTLGLFVIHWITGYMNLRMGGGLAYLPTALIYPVSVLSGIGPLWFIQLLFVFSGLLLLLRKIDRADRIWTLCQRANLPVVLLLFLLLFGAAQSLNLPVLTTYRFGIYFAAFLIGYYIFSHENVQEILERIRIPMAGLAIVGAALYAHFYGGSDYTSPACLQSLGTSLYLWTVVLALIGCGRKYWNRETAFTRYMTGAGFGIYILHYPVLIVTCYLLQEYLELPATGNYVLALFAGTVLTFALYEILKRIPLVRFMVLGVGGKDEN